MAGTIVESAFDLLDKWRHLPSYQLERRADIFFAVYLPEFLSDHLGLKINPLVIPEFPVKIEVEEGANPIFASNKIDYLAIAQNQSCALFIELKTDCGSRRDGQDAYLVSAQKKGLSALLADIIEIAQKSSAKQKYAQLILLAAALGLIDAPPELAARAKVPNARGLGAEFRKTKPSVHAAMPIKILYLQPTGDSGNVITFAAFAKWLKTKKDPIADRFGQSLLQWCSTAGCPS